eukprot:658615-Pelagomonas_calceolata.AAC.1
MFHCRRGRGRRRHLAVNLPSHLPLLVPLDKEGQESMGYQGGCNGRQGSVKGSAFAEGLINPESCCVLEEQCCSIPRKLARRSCHHRLMYIPLPANRNGLAGLLEVSPGAHAITLMCTGNRCSLLGVSQVEESRLQEAGRILGMKGQWCQDWIHNTRLRLCM